MNVSKYILLFTFTILLPYQDIAAQAYLFDAQLITTKDGLSNLMTTTTFKDKKGFLWISTPYGLNKYDGYNFQLFPKIQKANNPKLITEDDNRNLWLHYHPGFARTFGKAKLYEIMIFNPILNETTPFDTYFKDKAPFLSSEVILTEIIDPKKRQWFTTIRGELFLYENGLFKKIFEQAGTDFQFVTVDHNDHLWLGYNNQVIVINMDGAVLDTFDLAYPIFGIWADQDKTIWLATRNMPNPEDPHAKRTIEIWSIKEGGQIKPFQLNRDNHPLVIKDVLGSFIYRTSKGFWYVEMDNQLNVFSPSGNWIYNLNTLLGPDFNAEFQSFFEDDHYMWISTPIGLIKTSITTNPFQVIHQRKTFSDCRGITEDELGNIYFLNGPIYQWNPQTQQIKKCSKTTGAFTLIYEDSLLWSGIYSGNNVGFHLDLSTNETKFYPALDAPVAYTSLKTDRPSEYLIGHQKGITYLNLQQEKLLPFTKYKPNSAVDSLLQQSAVYHIHQNPTGIWLGTNHGIFLINEQDGILRHYSTATQDLPFDQIRHLYEEKENLFWLATKGGGVIQWQPSFNPEQASKSRQFTTKEGLSNNFTYAVYGDEYDNLWIPSDQGLMCMNKISFQVKTFSAKDGLPYHEFNQSAHFRAKDGTLYFGGLGGLIAFHPSVFVHQTANKTPIKFTSYRLLEDEAENMTDRTKLLDSTDEIIIKPTDKFFELQFALLDFDLPETHQYAYKIEGYSNQWNYTNENYIRITALPYGNYDLKIIGKNNSKDWSSQTLSLTIKVLKPFYIEWWFITAMIALGIGTIIAAVKWRIALLENDRNRLESEVLKRTSQIEKDKQIISKQAEDLKLLDQAKTRFFSNITHEFRTPLTLIIGPLKQYLKSANPSTQHSLSGVIKNAQHLLTLINQLLDLSKLEGGKMKVEVTHGDLVKYTKELVHRFTALAHKKEQRICFLTNQKKWDTFFDKGKWDKIIYNLLSNAIKFTPNGGAIQLSLFNTPLNGHDQIHLEIKDTGTGIEKEQLHQIFNRFYQTDSSSTRDQEGSGIGLALVKELVELQGGEIWVTSMVGKGTSFEIKLPILEMDGTMPAALQPTTMPLPTMLKETPSLVETLAPAYQKKEKLELLLVEDNAEMRQYIRSCLDLSNYHILEAGNGVEGIKKAIANIPDLIISDVMMPKKDGFELTRTIRDTISTSHIPIVLLTAKAALDSRLEGFRSGADAYLTKPFSPEELILRIHKLIEIRTLLQQRFTNGNNDLSLSKRKSFEQEDAFIMELRTFIVEHIEETNLNGDIIGKNFGMSRMQLHRKLKALTNQSLSEYLKTIRLNAAIKLLQEKKLNVSEVAYQTGFSSPSHFSRTFKQKFGKNPSEA